MYFYIQKKIMAAKSKVKAKKDAGGKKTISVKTNQKFIFIQRKKF